jgi:hypothetical protein
MVLQVLSDAAHLLDDVYAGILQYIATADTGKFQDLWRAD